MVLANELFQIPAPFDNLAGYWKNADKAKRGYPVERYASKRGVREIRRAGRTHRIHDFAPADGLAAKPRRDGIPVDEGKRRTAVVQRDPCPTTGFGRAEHGATVHVPLIRWETCGACQLFIAIHPKAITFLPRDKRDGTHGANQSAAG